MGLRRIFIHDEPLEEKMSPLVSVIVAAYNIKEYLPRCIDSLATQTMDNIEIVVVDDGSTDGTAKIIDTYAARDIRIVPVHKTNQGLPQARKSGFAKSTGEFICFVDGDDWFEPNYLEMLYTALRSTSASLSACDIILEYEGANNSSVLLQRDAGVVSSAEAIKLLHERRAVFVYVWNKMFRREEMEKVVFPTEHIVGEDYSVVTQLLERASTVALVNRPLCHYSQREGSMSKRGFNMLDLVAFDNYTSIEQHLSSKYPCYAQAISMFMVLERDLGMLFLMARGEDRCDSLIAAVRKNIGDNIMGYCLKSRDSLSYKLAAVIACLSPRLFFFMHRQFRRIRSIA